MPLDSIKLGTPPSGADGDVLRTAFMRINNNFKMMDDMGLTAPISPTRDISDLNQATNPGWYSALSGTTAHLPPGITYPVVCVAQTAVGFIVQIALDPMTGKSASRGFNANIQTWTDWRSTPASSDLGTAAFAALTTSTGDSTTGRVLKVGDFAIGGFTPGVVEGDIDALRSTGDYYVEGKSLGVLPFNTNGYLRVCSVAGSYSMQTFTAYNDSSLYQRMLINGKWTSWYEKCAPTTRLSVSSNLNFEYNRDCQFVDTTVNRPAFIAYGVVRTMWRVANGECVQVAWSVTNEFTAMRRVIGGVWTAWVNTTPMGTVGQGWQATARALNTSYVNDSGRPIQVKALVGPATQVNSYLQWVVGGVTLTGSYSGAAGQYIDSGAIIVPAGAAYGLFVGNNPGPLNSWVEMR